MRRYALMAAVTLPHLVLAVVLSARSVALGLETSSPEVGAAVDRAIWIQAVVLAAPTLLLLGGATGLWLRRRRGWAALAAADLILVALVVGDWLAGGRHVDHAPVLALLALLLAPLLLPGVRRALGGRPGEGPLDPEGPASGSRLALDGGRYAH